MSDRITAYADALLIIASAEDGIDSIKSQLREVTSAVAGNDELSTAIGNANLPASSRNELLDSLLDGKVSDTVRGMVGMVVGAGRGADLAAIVDRFSERSAAASGHKVATVRTAVALSEDQQARLASALAKTAGSDIDLQVIVDPSVVGGAVTTIGDTVIDGSLRTRLTQMREAL